MYILLTFKWNITDEGTVTTVNISIAYDVFNKCYYTGTVMNWG